MHEFRQKLDLKVKHFKSPSKIKIKHTFRVKAHDQKNKLAFFKVRTKKKVSTVRRVATMHGLTPDRIIH